MADVALVPARAPEGVSLFLVDPRAAGVTLTPMVGIDLTTRWSEIRLDGAAGEMMGAAGGAGPVLEGLLRRAAVGASAEMLGAARRCLDMSVGYAKVREQFGQLIGSFQSIRHRCAEMLLEVEKAHAAVYYAAWALGAGAEDATMAASVCKSFVSEAARQVYEAAEVTAEDIDVCELHDCLSANELITYEALGFAPEGEGHKLVERQATTYGGDGPLVNPSGGLIS